MWSGAAKLQQVLTMASYRFLTMMREDAAAAVLGCCAGVGAAAPAAVAATGCDFSML
jgi:hypothetical protein